MKPRIKTLLSKANLPPYVSNEYRKSDIRHCYADTTKAQKLLDFKPTITLQEGLTELAEWAITHDWEAIDLFEKALRKLREKTLRNLISTTLNSSSVTQLFLTCKVLNIIGINFYHMEEKITNYAFAILNLYRTNYAKSLHIRAMAKLLNTSHVTLLPHLKKLEKNKILISRKVGKNKEYLLNPNNILTKDYLTVAEKLETIKYLQRNFLIKKILENLLTVNAQNTIVLFGSYTKDYATEASDIDLFYLGKLSENQIMEIKKIGKIYGKEISIKTSTIKNFNEGLISGDTLIKEIVKDHIILQNPDLFVNLLWRNFTGK